MTEGEQLLEAILDDPKSDDRRLVYADWLEEQGNLVAADRVRKASKLIPEDRTRYMGDISGFVVWNRLVYHHHKDNADKDVTCCPDWLWACLQKHGYSTDRSVRWNTERDAMVAIMKAVLEEPSISV